MVDFKKGYWNLGELEIQEWIEPKQKGFMKFDVETLKNKLIEDFSELFGYQISGTIGEIEAVINKRFGIEV